MDVLIVLCTKGQAFSRFHNLLRESFLEDLDGSRSLEEGGYRQDEEDTLVINPGDEDMSAAEKLVCEVFSCFRLGSCSRCNPPKAPAQVLSLVDYCIHDIARYLLRYEEVPPGLPHELVDRLIKTLIRHNALMKPTLAALQHCEITRLSLSTCKDVEDDWLAPLESQPLEMLDLSNCVKLTDAGLLHLKALQNLQSASLRSGLQLRDSAILALSLSTSLTCLDLTDCRKLTDETLRNIRHLTNLTSLIMDGCKALTDGGLVYLTELKSLETLSLAQCEQLTDRGITTSLTTLQQLQTLNLGFCLKLTDYCLVGMAFLPSLTSLDLTRCSLTNEGLFALRPLTALKVLSLRGCTSVTDRGMDRLPSSITSLNLAHCRGVRRVPFTRLPNLTCINLASTGITDPQLADIPNLSHLTDLDLDSCAIGDDGVAHLRGLTRLKRLNLADTDTTNTGVEVLGTLVSLTSLSLFYCNVTDRAISHLVKLPNLVSLNLDNRDITDSSMAQLATLTKLESLDLFSARVSDYGLAVLSTLTNLTGLELCGGRVTDRGLFHVAKLSQLRTLNLSQNSRITNSGLVHLSHLHSLTSLNLSHCQVGGAGAVSALTRLRSLENLALNGCRGVSESVQRQLRQDMPCLKHLRAL